MIEKYRKYLYLVDSKDTEYRSKSSISDTIVKNPLTHYVSTEKQLLTKEEVNLLFPGQIKSYYVSCDF